MPHPDTLGCNIYCHGDMHATTVLSMRATGAEVLADLFDAFTANGYRLMDAHPCEMAPAQWWTIHPRKGTDDVREEVVFPPASLGLYTVWRVLTVDSAVSRPGRRQRPREKT